MAKRPDPPKMAPKSLTTDAIVTAPVIPKPAEPEPVERQQPTVPDTVEAEVKQPTFTSPPKRYARLHIPGFNGRFHGNLFDDDGNSEEPLPLAIKALAIAQFGEGVTEID